MKALPRLPELRLAAIDPAPAGMEGARMSYMEAGAGEEVVLLLHGIGSNCAGWRYVLDALAPHYRVIAWNAPGYYLTDHLRADAPGHEQYADALAALMDALGIAAAHVAGSSFGSMIAASFAARHPHRVRRLALMGASRGQKWLPAEERARRLAMRDATSDEGAVAMSEKRWQVLLGPGADATTIRLTREVLMATHPRGLKQAARASDDTDTCEFAPRIAAPTLFIIGSEDRVNPPEVTRAIAAQVAGSRIETLPGIGHLPKLEAPAATSGLLRAHFAA
jgi:pimeloyl-ACP methyl ester carboxylesterase